jgi:dihydroflavonol-4-reductase
VTDRVLVTGGSGLVGRALVRRLVGEGREVVALARSDAAGKTLRSDGARPVAGDVLDPSSVRAAAVGCSSVFHVAGVNAMCLRDPSGMYATNVEGSANVVRAAAAGGVRRIVHTSSAATLGEARGVIATETSAHRGSFLSHYERSKRMAEDAVLALGRSLDVEVVCVNPSSVQGPGRVDGSARLLLELVNGRLRAVVDTWVSLVDIDDCARGHVLAETRGASGERYVLNGASVRVHDAVAIVRRVWGRPGRVRTMPPWVARLAGAAAEASGRLSRRDLPVCREAVRTLLHGHRYDGSRAAHELGLRYTPLEVTLERTLAWYAERGLVPPRRKADEAP